MTTLAAKMLRGGLVAAAIAASLVGDASGFGFSASAVLPGAVGQAQGLACASGRPHAPPAAAAHAGQVKGASILRAPRGSAPTLLRMCGASTAELEGQIAEQGNKVRGMKEAMKADPDSHTKDELDAAVAVLKELKAKLSPPVEKPKKEEKPKAAQPQKGKKKKDEEPEVSPREERSVRVGKAEKFREKGQNPYEYTWDVTHKMKELQAEHTGLANGEQAEGASVSVAGRVMAKRVFGKLAFYTLADPEGTIQLYLEQASIGEGFDDLKTMVDVGDFIGVKGGIKRTDKGELSVTVSEWSMLTKSILPLPDKFKGLTDVNIRYRRRYLDMIVNPTVRETFRKRAAITQGIRNYLAERDFIEIETPVLTSDVGGAEARPFVTHHNALDMELYMRIATGMPA